MLRSTDETLLLVAIHCRCAVAEITPAAVANLDEYDLVFMGHHEVDLARAGSVVSRQCSETATRQESFGRTLRAATPLRRRRALKGPR
jgi:hypothetical protein